MKAGDRVKLLGPLEPREQPLVGQIGILVRIPDLSWNKRYVPDPNLPVCWLVAVGGKNYPLFEDELELVEES